MTKFSVEIDHREPNVAKGAQWLASSTRDREIPGSNVADIS